MINDLQAIAQYLFGGGWQTPLAEALGVADRTVRRWMAGQAVPAGAWDDIVCLAAEKQVADAWPVIEGMLKKYGKPETIELYVYGKNSKIKTMHPRPWSAAADRAIKEQMCAVLGAAGIKAVVIER